MIDARFGMTATRSHDVNDLYLTLSLSHAHIGHRAHHGGGAAPRDMAHGVMPPSMRLPAGPRAAAGLATLTPMR